MTRTAAALVIGNELLSGKIAEANVVALARRLRALGVDLRRVVMVQDDVDTIAHEVWALSSTHDWLFTSGGVGPTHDDVTVAAVARAFGVDVVRSPELEALIRTHYGDRTTEGHLHMAAMPAGASLETTEDVRWPTIRIENVWLLPGIPEVFLMKLPVATRALEEDATSFVTRAVYTKMDEGDLKPILDRVVARFPDVAVGSYPKWRDPAYKTKVTFDGTDEPRVEAAREAFIADLPEGEPQLEVGDL